MSLLPVFDSSVVLLFLLEATLKGSLVLAAAGVATSLLRRSPAAVRHTIWTTALVAVAVIPAILAYAPKYDVGVLPATEPQTPLAQPSQESSVAPLEPTESARFDAEIVEPAFTFTEKTAPKNTEGPILVAPPSAPVAPARINPHSSFDWWMGILALWSIGFAVVTLRYAIGWIALHRIRSQSEPVADVRFRLAAIKVARSMGLKRRVQFVWGLSSGMPLTWGFFRPTVLLPEEARRWKPEKILAVLRHELAHIKRWDCLVQALIYFVCAIHWFNPLVWIAAAHSRKEREMACDDYVILGGTTSTAYADHLLEIARSLRTPKMSGVSTIAMARPTELEGRLMAILSEDRHRSENTRMGLFATMGLLTAVALPLATVRPVPVEPADASLAIEESELEPDAAIVFSELESDLTGDETGFAPLEGFDPVEPLDPIETLDRAELVDLEAAESELHARESEMQSAEATQRYIEQANRLVEQATRTLESIERLQPTVSAWQAEFGNELSASITPLILGQIIASPDTIPLAQIKRLKAAGIDTEYIEELASVGIKRLTVDELVSLAHANVDADYILQLRQAGYKDLTPSELSRLAFANVEPEDIAVWAELGYDDLETEDLIRLAHADVDADFVMAMAELGYRGLGPEDLTRMSHADVDPEFVAEMRRAGYANLSADELIRLGHANIDADYVREMSEYGLTNLSPDDLVRLGHADVDASYIEAMRTIGHQKVTADDLIRMSHADVDPSFVRQLSRAGYDNLSPDELIRFGHANVDARYISELRDVGMSNLTADDLVRLSHADVEADFVNELKGLGLDVSDVDEVVRLKYINLDTEYIKRIQEAEIRTND